MNLKNLLPTPRTSAEFRRRREARAADRQLQRELATYTTPAEIADLMALLEKQDGPEAEHIRALLSRNLVAASYRDLRL